MNNDEKFELFFNHIQNISSVDTYHNFYRGSNCKFTCLYLCYDEDTFCLVENCCVQFAKQTQGKQNQVLLDWYQYSKLAHPTNKRKKAMFLIMFDFSANEPCIQSSLFSTRVYASAIIVICGVG